MRDYDNIHRCFDIITDTLQRRSDHEEIHCDAALHFNKIRGVTVGDDDI